MMIKVAMPNQFKIKVEAPFRTILFPERQEIHYIGGADVLPPPLEAEEEGKVILWLGTEKEEYAKKMLIEHNLRLVVYIAKKFDNTGVGIEDLISIGTIGLIKGISTFDPEKGVRLATYAARCVENATLTPASFNRSIVYPKIPDTLIGGFLDGALFADTFSASVTPSTAPACAFG